MKIKLINSDNILTAISINPNIKLHELYALAIKRKIIPYTQKGVCVMRINGSLQIMIYFEEKNVYIYPNTQGDCSINDVFNSYNKEWHELINFFSFNYYTSVIEYAKALFIAYGCNKTYIFRDGWYDVYSLCDIPAEIEKDWIEQCNKSEKSKYDDNKYLNS
ncbi:hypothetical protein [uncultured Bacteroides sp.]|uniref:hypothetical protein n=1 Tax=uncultured Bacteroides sp. TaxID=162156 RepID=UPI0025FB0667|nr:hypothetical protein [uncultured Bacteroides sp.]